MVTQDPDGALGDTPGVSRITCSATATTGASRMVITIATK